MLEIEVNKELGGNLSSVKFNGLEMLHQPDPDNWMGQDVNIFPFTARLKDGKYLVNGKEYSMKNHGLVRYMKPEVIFDQANYKLMRFTSSDETLAQYPFPFVYKVEYLVNHNTLTVTSSVENTGNQTMFFGLGWHPAIRIPHFEKDGKYCIEGSNIEFPKRIMFNRYFTDEKGNYITKEGPYKKLKKINLSKSLFKDNISYILDASKVREVTLNRKDGIKVVYKISKAKILTIWTMEKGGDYICIEPWYGVPDYAKPTLELKDKKLINSLEAGKTFNASYSMTFYDQHFI